MSELENSVWGTDSGVTATVLQSVLRYVSPSDLRSAAAVCHAWHRATCADSLWRHVLNPHATPDALRELRHTWEHNQHIASWRVWNWRREGALVDSRWEHCTRLRHTAGTDLLHASLDRTGTALAMLAEQAQLSVWERSSQLSDSDWLEVWSGRVSDEWSSAGAVEWAPHQRRLLVAGPLLLADRWELVVIDFTEKWCGKVVCRASSSAGTWPTWLDDAHFITLHTRLAAPHCATTRILINSTTQSTYSEHAGVLAPLLRVYNEAGANITFTSLTDCRELRVIYGPNRVACTLLSLLKAVSGGSRGGVRGEARSLLSWQLPTTLTVPPVYLREGLAERLLARQQRNAEPPEEPPEEDAVRALCSRPDNICVLPAAVLGLTLHPTSGCVWASTTDGVACISLPALRLVLWLPTRVGLSSLPLYRLQPHADHDYVVSPTGGGSGEVQVWSVRSGLCNTTLSHANLALVALLPPTEPAPSTHSLLVLTTEALHIWRSNVPTFSDCLHGMTRFMSHISASRHMTKQQSCHTVPRDSCTPKERPPCPPCNPSEPPPCRRSTRTTPSAIRKVCCAPPEGHRPPCPPLEKSCTLTCDNQLSTKMKNQSQLFSQRSKCGAQLDRVAQRLAAAEEWRHKQYEEELSQPLPARKASSPAPYSLTGERHCARATDGRDYMCPQVPAPARTCKNGVPPPPTSVPIMSFEACDIQRSRHLDPCAHKPRVFVEIDRTSTIKSSKREESKTPVTSTCPRQNIREKDRCKTLPQIVEVPPPCREPTLVERLRRGIGGTSGEPPRRALHTLAREIFFSTVATGCSDKTSVNNLSTALKESEILEEVARGRTVGLIKSQDNLKPKNSNSGYLKLPIPPHADSVRVHVTLDVLQPTETVNAALNCGHSGPSDSWLSIKNIQKKFASNKRKPSKQSDNNNSCPVRPARIPANPCVPSRKPNTPPSTPPTSNPCTPKNNQTRSLSALHPPYVVIF